VPVAKSIALDNVAEEEEEEEEEEEDVTPTMEDDWNMGTINMDTHLTSGSDYHSVKAKFTLSIKLSASPADYFLHFLPMEYINEVVIRNINTHALSVIDSWVSVTFLEYLTWMALLMNMTVMHHVDKRAYWHMGSSHLFPNIDFTEYMEYVWYFSDWKLMESNLKVILLKK
jgi:hypothetical protein